MRVQYPVGADFAFEAQGFAEGGEEEFYGGGAYPGNSDGLYLVVTCDTTLTGATATLQIKLVSDDSAAISTTTSTVHYVSPVHTVGGAGVTAGGVICVVELPRGDYERYLGILQVTGVTNITAGKINAFLTMDPKTFTPIAAPDAI